MKNLLLLSMLLVFTSCSRNLFNFTALSSLPAQVNVTDQKQVTGKSISFMGFGASVQKATTNAITSAGPGYNMLLNGTVTVKRYPLFIGYEVSGTAIKSSTIQ